VRAAIPTARGARTTLLAVAVTVAVGCNAIAGLGDIGFGDVGGGGGGAAAPATTSATAGGAGSSGTTATGGTATTASGPGSCGNGSIDKGEECDDGNGTDGDGCTDCVVDCSEPGAFKLKETHHCYWFVDLDASWAGGRGQCVLAGADLVAFSSEKEHAAVTGLVPSSTIWTGGSDTAVEGTFVWANGEPWLDTLWASGRPNMGDTYNCVQTVPTAGMRLRTDVCTGTDNYVCERTPAGEKVGP
jgi:cysteine-rich repeat protein